MHVACMADPLRTMPALPPKADIGERYWMSTLCHKRTSASPNRSPRRRGTDAGHKTQRTAEVSCGEFRTLQHWHVAGHSPPNSSSTVAVGLGISRACCFGEYSVPMPNGCRIGKTATVWGTKAKPSVVPKPRRLCCSPTPARRFRQTLWPRCAESDQDFAMSALSQEADFPLRRCDVRFGSDS